MSPRATEYACSACGYRSPRWLGRCPDCGAWDTMSERVRASATRPAAKPAALSRRRWYAAAEASRDGAPAARPQPLVSIEAGRVQRFSSGLSELDRVLGGGYVPASCLLVAGDPGIGKSTLMLQSAAAVAGGGDEVLYVSAEEVPQALRGRAERLDALAPGLLVLGASELEEVLAAAHEVAPRLLVVDSIQAVYARELPSMPGTVSQVREVALAVARFARATGTAALLLGHVNKEGSIAGPKVLEHLVDVVISFGGERHHPYRILRTVKSRYGPAGEVGLFEMTGKGLVGVRNPSALFLRERPVDRPGSAVTCVLTGARPLLAEVQALVSHGQSAQARRVIQGFDSRRAAFLLAVIENALRFPMAGRDVFVNAVGGVVLDEPAADLAVVLALVSSLLERVVPPDLVALGEVGLTGELRRVDRVAARLREAGELGFRRALLPRSVVDRLDVRERADLELLPVDHLAGAVERLFAGHDLPAVLSGGAP